MHVNESGMILNEVNVCYLFGTRASSRTSSRGESDEPKRWLNKALAQQSSAQFSSFFIFLVRSASCVLPLEQDSLELKFVNKQLL